MRNSEKLSALTRAYGDPPSGLRLSITSELNGAIRSIEGWPHIHRALSVLVGYTEEGSEIEGLTYRSDHEGYIRQLIYRFGPDTDNFPPEIVNNIEAPIRGISEQVPLIVHVLKQMSPEPSESALTVEFPGTLSLEEFQVAVRDIGTVVDLLKIENDVSQVWTDYGSTIFGIDVGTTVSLVVLSAAVVGAAQFRDIVVGLTPETLATAFKLFDFLSQRLLGNSLDPKIMESEDAGELVKNFARGEVTVELTSDVSNEQQNGLRLAIPKLAAMSDRGWRITCSRPTIENSQITHSTIILAETVNLALTAGEFEHDQGDAAGQGSHQ